MKQKNQAFTLIELLVVIVIIGILATISTSTFSGSMDKARDVKRQVVMNEIKNLLFSFYIDRKERLGDSYVDLLSFRDDFPGYLDDNGFAEYEATDDICIYLGADNTEWILMTWGNTTSTDDASNEGVLYTGSTDFVADWVASGESLTKVDFSCDIPTSENTFGKIDGPNPLGSALLFGVSGDPIRNGSW